MSVGFAKAAEGLERSREEEEKRLNILDDEQCDGMKERKQA